MTLLDRILTGRVPAYALLHRAGPEGDATLDVVTGPVSAPTTIAGIQLPDRAGPGHDALVLVPFRQIAERGLACVDDGTPLLVMAVSEQARYPLAEVVARIPDTDIDLLGGGFDIDDATYAETVRRVVADDIGTGRGANFVIKRVFRTTITGSVPRSALTLFRRLLEGEAGAYWTFLVHTGDRVLVGATPERHISVAAGTAVMNPISGTYRYPASGPTLPDVMAFLADTKETNELFMVLDEELKMMARICETGGRVEGPHLREMARLAHTEYLIEGRTASDPRRILLETMFAPTVTGSPLASACRVIVRHEPEGRGYYGGVAALLGRDHDSRPTLDSSILIRTADISCSGAVRIGVGATIVRDSDPVSEAAETRAKAAGLIAALGVDRPVRIGEHPQVRAALVRRNTGLARYWMAGPEPARRQPALAGLRVLLLDAEDSFTFMLGHQLQSMGLAVTLRAMGDRVVLDDHDLVLLGPGPGDPRDDRDPRIRRIREVIDRLLAERRPFLAVCLSHQSLSLRLGLDVTRRDVPNQGVQRDIELFGTRERVGFYNTFAARCAQDRLHLPGLDDVEISRDRATGEVHALRGPHFTSLQFHAESVLTTDGVRILGDCVRELLAGAPLRRGGPRPPPVVRGVG